MDGEVRETSTSVGELTVSPAVLSDEAYLVVTAVGALTATAGDLVGAERTSIGSTGALTGSAGDLAGAERTTVGATGNLTVTGGGLSGGVATAVASGPAVWIEYDDTYVSTPTRDLGTGPFTDLSASFWMKTDDYAGISLGMINGHGTNGSTIFLYISSGYLGYQEGDDGGQHENDWRAELATDGERHHYGMKAGQFYIDGVPVTMTNSSGG
ncbi:LamG domain-containing protein, partial [Candidatus Bathyarchaeota archaeon]|nr:LamG domain-containing protein [Candidatus Bathyarchaeota archaeon]